MLRRGNLKLDLPGETENFSSIANQAVALGCIYKAYDGR